MSEAIRRIIRFQGSRLGNRFSFEESPVAIDEERLGSAVGWYRNPQPGCETIVFGERGVLVFGQHANSNEVRYADIERVEAPKNKKDARDVRLLVQGSVVAVPVTGCDPENEKYRDVYVVATLFLLIARSTRASARP